MKTDDFKPFDDVADSMTAAASRLGVSLSVVKMAKRNGSEAFRGSRVHLGKLREELASAEKESPGGASDVLFMIAQEVALRVSYALARCRGKRFVADSDKMCQAIHNGFAVALCIVEPDSVDDFLTKNSTLFEGIFEKKREMAAVERKAKRQ